MATATPYSRTQKVRNYISVYNYYNDYEGKPTVVSLYESWVQYGGSEEGGWYYECGEPIKCICVFNKKQAIRAALQLQAEAEKIWGEQRDYLGWNQYVISFEKEYPQKYPQQRPHYC